jgi:RNA 2',3'-cyclic 3'-phosphodiesterase
VRLFLAINLEPEVRKAIVDATASLRTAAPTLSWIDETRLHLTLKFLGERRADVVGPLSDSVNAVTAGHTPFSMELRDIGAFPNFRRARVVWMGIEREPRLELLHHDIELACEQLGFELDGRPFRPHLTLARVKERTEAEELKQLARASKRITFEREVGVASVDVMKSDMTVTPSRYERLHAARLRSH